MNKTIHKTLQQLPTLVSVNSLVFGFGPSKIKHIKWQLINQASVTVIRFIQKHLLPFPTQAQSVQKSLI